MQFLYLYLEQNKITRDAAITWRPILEKRGKIIPELTADVYQKLSLLMKSTVISEDIKSFILSNVILKDVDSTIEYTQSNLNKKDILTLIAQNIKSFDLNASIINKFAAIATSKQISDKNNTSDIKINDAIDQFTLKAIKAKLVTPDNVRDFIAKFKYEYTLTKNTAIELVLDNIMRFIDNSMKMDFFLSVLNGDKYEILNLAAILSQNFTILSYFFDRYSDLYEKYGKKYADQFSVITNAVINSGGLENAIKVLRSIKDENHKNKTFLKLLIKNYNTNKAFEAIKKIDNNNEKIKLLYAFAELGAISNKNQTPHSIYASPVIDYINTMIDDSSKKENKEKISNYAINILVDWCNLTTVSMHILTDFTVKNINVLSPRDIEKALKFIIDKGSLSEAEVAALFTRFKCDEPSRITQIMKILNLKEDKINTSDKHNSVHLNSSLRVPAPVSVQPINLQGGKKTESALSSVSISSVQKPTETINELIEQITGYKGEARETEESRVSTHTPRRRSRANSAEREAIKREAILFDKKLKEDILKINAERKALELANSQLTSRMFREASAKIEPLKNNFVSGPNETTKGAAYKNSKQSIQQEELLSRKLGFKKQ